ncbi:hypothetical protein KP509_26G039500 [Ceratopteris richardii]|uniref:DRBM domain-containing protein n=1 Tax=Ceratopteris richardii TaxID=49495 RepID=A0A8T2RK47_CERRI|nr:hypothetical protein KP509_26G039500 [Ceratopteris richardii]KAH7296799.1 hypothetical protein KP509_26G039500 [Ceratopteris richardii]KAH7296800.1 hypothetical protein KP509_26G039500 [Ceratopteris richardii]
MYKNQLQELAQRSCVNLPAYSCIREGPDHAPRFKATVNFNGEIFESPHFCTTLRQAEHAAAEVALNTLSKRGPSQFLAAKIMDETSVCKNLLQETAQRVGVSLPVYTTMKLGPGHLPVFKCLVEVAGKVFAGEPAKTKKQAEKNAAMAAWSVIKQWKQPPSTTSPEGGSTNDADGGNNSNALTLYRRDNKASQMQPFQRRYGGRANTRVVNFKGKNRVGRDSSPASGHFQYAASSSFASPSAEVLLEDRRFVFGSQSNVCSGMDSSRSIGGYQRSPAVFDGDSTTLITQDAFAKGRACGNSIGGILPLPRHHQPQLQQQRLSRFSFQSHSDRFELRRSLMEELELHNEEGDEDWLSGLGKADSLMHHSQKQQCHPQSLTASPSDRRHSGLERRAMFQSQSDRFELKPSVLDELYYNDEEGLWLRGEIMQPAAMLERARLHSECENGCIVCYDGNRVSSHSSQDSISLSSNDFGSMTNAFGVGYRDASNMQTSTFRDVPGSDAPYSFYSDGKKFAGPFVGFQGSSSSNLSYDDVERGSSFKDNHYHGDRASSYIGSNYEMDRSTSSYVNFSTIEGPTHYYFNSEGGKNTFSGYQANVRNRGLSDNESGPSSSSPWPSAAHLWMSTQAGSQIPGLRHANSIAPPVRIRQTIAVCSAPPPRCPTIESTAASNSYLQERNPPSILEDPTGSSEASACELFSQLRI